MVSRSIFCGIAVAFSLFAGAPVQADATLGVQGSDGLDTSIQIRNGKGRISSVGRKDYLLYDSDAGIITYVEPGYQRYTQLTVAELDAAVQAAAGVRDTVTPYVEGMLSGLPEEQRKAVEQQMGAILAPPAAGKPLQPVDIRIVDQGKQTVAGLQCQASSLLKDGTAVAEVCMATSASGKLTPADFATLAMLVKVSRSMAGNANSMLGGISDQADLLSVDLQGVPVSMRDVVSGKYYQVTGVSDEALPDVLFDNYDGYQRQGIQDLLR